MEIGVISDVHSNLPALESVLKELDKRDVDEIICGGDLVGYYPYPNEVLDLISSRNIKCVRGNHDEAVLTGTPQNYNDTAIETLKWTRNQIDEEKKQIINKYPIERVEKYDDITAHVVHGSPLYPFTDYIYPEDINHKFIKENLVKSPNFLILGHTHEQFRVNVGKTTVVNPGSVGQPRDGEQTAGYAVIDTEYGSATLYRVSYDIDKTKNKIKKENLPKILAKRLSKGK